MVQSQYGHLSHHIDFDCLPHPAGRFKLLDVVGEGTYGEVYACYDLAQDKKVAVKVMENIADNIEEIEEEFMILKELSRHPNMPDFYGLYMKPGPDAESDQLWFVMELCAGGSVTDLVKTLKKRGHCLSERIIAYILRETMQALLYLHLNRCMHRDIKGHNILMSADASIILVDFGKNNIIFTHFNGVSSHVMETFGKRNTSVGTPYWMAPEVIACERQLGYEYDVRCDVWSLGITAIELGDSEPPLSDLHPMKALFKIPRQAIDKFTLPICPSPSLIISLHTMMCKHCNDLEYIRRNPPPMLRNPDYWSDEYKDFVEQCLVKNFEERPTIAELMQHPFIQQIPKNPQSIKDELARVLQQHKRLGLLKVAPEVTTKCGRLKESRRTKARVISADDLAALEHLTEANSKSSSIGPRAYGASGPPPALHIFPPLQLPDTIVKELEKRYNEDNIYTYVGDILIAFNPFKLLPIYSQKAANRILEDKILQVNPIIEAFGNATTGFNDNSS
ncbi:Myosin-IIIa [Nymphon striatum]|nr:Myosin-IIIa [Nymphon striatum]